MSDKIYLFAALKLAQIRRGCCAPNPSVGAIIVKNGMIIGEGYHYQAGDPHAEVNALNSLSDEDAAGSTVYVTLEPCCHTGRTPPCTDLLIRRKVARVVYGYTDPNPIVAGNGAARLKRAGILGDYLPLEEIAAFYKSYAYWRAHHRPFLTAKLALSADNNVALAHRHPAKITNELTDQFTHEQRLHSDALLTTVETVIQDNPKLNVRIGAEIIAKPVYVIDRLLRFPLSSQLVNTASSLTLFHGPDVDSAQLKKIQQHGIACVELPVDHHHVNLNLLLDFLGNAGMHDVWLEAGPVLFKALITTHLAQAVYLYRSPIHLGEHAYSADLPDSLFQHFTLKNKFYLARDEINYYID